MILTYILLAMFATLMLAGAVVVVFRMGENELICKYDYLEDDEK